MTERDWIIKKEYRRGLQVTSRLQVEAGSDAQKLQNMISPQGSEILLKFVVAMLSMAVATGQLGKASCASCRHSKRGHLKKKSTYIRYVSLLLDNECYLFWRLTFWHFQLLLSISSSHLNSTFLKMTLSEMRRSRLHLSFRLFHFSLSPIICSLKFIVLP